MSQESMDSTIHALYDAFNRRDWTAMREVASPDVVVEEAPGTSPEVRTYRGWTRSVRISRGFTSSGRR
jgi:ketosteroid isomerase-like protein